MQIKREMLINIIFRIELEILTVIEESRSGVEVPIKNVSLPTTLPERSRQVPGVIIRLPNIEDRLARKKSHAQAKKWTDNPLNQKSVVVKKEITLKKPS
jgi:hypothetical protein